MSTCLLKIDNELIVSRAVKSKIHRWMEKRRRNTKEIVALNIEFWIFLQSNDNQHFKKILHD